LKRLEAHAIPAGEPKVIEVQFVSVEKVVTGSRLIEIDRVRYFAATRGQTDADNANAEFRRADLAAPARTGSSVPPRVSS
jgi:hypothetical protein